MKCAEDIILLISLYKDNVYISFLLVLMTIWTRKNVTYSTKILYQPLTPYMLPNDVKSHAEVLWVATHHRDEVPQRFVVVWLFITGRKILHPGVKIEVFSNVVIVVAHVIPRMDALN